MIPLVALFDDFDCADFRAAFDQALADIRRDCSVAILDWRFAKPEAKGAIAMTVYAAAAERIFEPECVARADDHIARQAADIRMMLRVAATGTDDLSLPSRVRAALAPPSMGADFDVKTAISVQALSELLYRWLLRVVESHMNALAGGAYDTATTIAAELPVSAEGSTSGRRLRWHR